MSEYGRGKSLENFFSGDVNGFYSGGILNRDCRYLQRRFRHSSDSKDRARGRRLWKVIGEYPFDFVRGADVFQINLQIDHMVHGQASFFHDGFDVVERLPNLSGGIRRQAAVCTAWPLSGNVKIAVGQNSRGAKRTRRRSNTLRRYAFDLRASTHCTQQSDRSSTCDSHAAFPLRAALKSSTASVPRSSLRRAEWSSKRVRCD